MSSGRGSLSTSVSSTLSSSLSSCLDEDLPSLMKSSLPSKFSALVTMHLSFMLDLSGTGLSELIDDRQQAPVDPPTSTTAAENRTKIISSVLFPRKKHTKDQHKSSAIFGCPLNAQSIDRIYPVIEFLARPENLKHEGLFRKAGHVDRQRLLCDRLNADGEKPHLQDFTVHDCANVLKIFLGELPEPLLTEKYLTAYRQVADMQSDSKRLQTMQLLVQLLPVEHATLLRHLLNLLHCVTLEPANRMTADNLAILFVPHVIVPRKTPLNELQQTSANFTGLMSLMITQASELFRCPEPLVRDITLYYRTVHECVGTLLDDEENFCSSSCSVQRKDDLDEDVIVTSVGFADREASHLAAIQFDTAKAIAELYDHVTQMPDSAHKRRLMKQFNKSMGTPSSATPNKRKFTLSFTQSIMRMVRKRHRSNTVTDEGLQSANDTEDTTNEAATPARPISDYLGETSASGANTPVKKLFSEDSLSQRGGSEANSTPAKIGLENRGSNRCPVAAVDSELSCHSTVVDRPSVGVCVVEDDVASTYRSSSCAETTKPTTSKHPSDAERREESNDDDCDDDSDKENVSSCSVTDAVFMFHHTPSVIAMERIFAQQRLPGYAKPKGYISPLRCPRYVMNTAHSTSVTMTATP